MFRSSTTSSDPLTTGVGADGLAVEAPASTGRARLAGAIVVATFLGVAAGTGVLDAVKPKPPPAAAAGLAKLKGASLSDGAAMREVETWLRLRSRVRQTVLPVYSVALWRGFGQVPGELIAGEDDWLFLKHRIPGPHLREERVCKLGANLIAAIQRRLAARGIHLLLVPIPDKCMVYEEQLPRAYAARPDLYRALIARMKERGVHAVDLLTPLRAERDRKVYSKTDSHWTERGMLVAAREVAAALGRLVPEPRRTRIVSAGAKPEEADMLPMLGIRPEKIRDAVELREPAETFVVLDENGTDTGSIERDMTDVILVGSSYSGKTRFRDFLEHFTGEEIWRSAFGGAGTEEPMLHALETIASTRQPAVIVWEYPAAFFLWPEGPLPAFGEVLAATGRPRVDPLAGISVEIERASDPPEGRTPETPPLTVIDCPIAARTLPGALATARGDGSTSLRLRGEVQGDDVVVVMETSGWRYQRHWKPGTREMILPYVSDEEHDDCNVVLLPRSRTELRLDGVDVVRVVSAKGPR